MRLRAQTSVHIAALLVIGPANAAWAAGSPYRPSLENKDRNEEVFQSALNEIRHKNYEQGRVLLKRLVGRKCSLKPAAILLIADSYYREGGYYDLTKAGLEYANWLGLYPEHELAPLVMKKLAETHLRQLYGRGADNNVWLANRALLKLQELYPQFNDDPDVQEHVMITQELRAEHELNVARFYFDNRESGQAAKMRCLEALKAPQFTKMDIALWYLGQAEELLSRSEEPEEGNISDAIQSYERIAREHLDSEYRDKAIERLKYFGRDVPEPDPEFNAKSRERASKIEPILADLSGYVTRISHRGVLLDEEDGVDRGGLNRILK